MAHPTTTNVRSSDGVELAVHDFGGDGPTILFAHATGFHGMVWAPIIDELGPDFHSVSVDLRGHGDSGIPHHGSFDWSGFADDVEAVIAHLGAPRPLFGVGHSKGGAALLLAEQRRPGTFVGMYLFEPIVFHAEARSRSASMAESPLAVGARRRREVFASRDEAYQNYASKPPLDALDPRALWAYVDHGFADLDDGSVRLKCRGEHEAAVYSMSAGHDAFDHLERVRCPVTVAAGALSDGIPAALAEPIASGLPAGTFERHTQLGHFGPLEAPELIAERIRSAFSPTTTPR